METIGEIRDGENENRQKIISQSKVSKNEMKETKFTP